MQTSARGLEVLEHEEGVVLRAYRCPAGVWTIGAGLTAASGVVKPVAGMQITQDVARDLLIKALRRNYEPTVEMAMSQVSGSKVTRPEQHEFDAGVSFHFNTGAIKRASWVKSWAADKARMVVRDQLLAWSKGGGRVLPGLKARRIREADMLLDGKYPGAPRVMGGQSASLALTTDADEFARIRASLSSLGYAPGSDTTQILRAAVIKFQSDHGLTADGIIGRATLSTLQRRINAPKAAMVPAVATAPATMVDVDTATGLPWADWAVLALLALWLARVAWSYRDVIAAKINSPLPRLAAKLRSF